MSSRRERRLPTPQGKKKRGEREGGLFELLQFQHLQVYSTEKERKKYCSPLTLHSLPYLSAV